MKSKRRYTRDFKKEAVRLYSEAGAGMRVHVAEAILGYDNPTASQATICKWESQLREAGGDARKAWPGSKDRERLTTSMKTRITKLRNLEGLN